MSAPYSSTTKREVFAAAQEFGELIFGVICIGVN